jgi:hypothetical protein
MGWRSDSSSKALDHQALKSNPSTTMEKGEEVRRGEKQKERREERRERGKEREREKKEKRKITHHQAV